MTIEFQCPFCKALIRVPDNAGGGKGKCPKCATRLTVPKVSPPKLAAPPPEDEPVQFAPPPATDSPFASVASSPAAAEDSVTFDAAGPETMEAAAPSDPADIFAAAPRPSIRPSSTAGKLKHKQTGGIWLLPLGFGLIVCGVAGWYFWQQFQTEQLGGELIAETADSLELPPRMVAKSSIRRPSDEVEAALSKLEKKTLPLISPLMQVQLSGSSKGLLVHLNAGTQARFYRVAVQGHEPLKKFLSQHAAEFEVQRMYDVEQSGTAFVAEYRKVIEKTADPSALTDFQKSLALPALVRGLGHQIVATYGRTIYPCVYEDYEGALYFLLPPDAKEFEISGRKHADGSVVFPATYKIKVAGMLKVPAKKDEETADNAKDKKSKDKKGTVSKRSDEPEEKMDTKDEDGSMPKKKDNSQ